MMFPPWDVRTGLERCIRQIRCENWPSAISHGCIDTRWSARIALDHRHDGARDPMRLLAWGEAVLPFKPAHPLRGMNNGLRGSHRNRGPRVGGRAASR